MGFDAEDSAVTLVGGPAVAGEEFGAWVTPHLRVLRAVATREVGVDDSADLVQNTLLRAWRRRHTFAPDRGTPRSWLMAILLDQARRQRSRAHPLSARTGPRALSNSADGDVNGRLDVDHAIRTLPRRQRQVIVLHYLADLSVRDVAAVLGVSEGSVKAYLSEARAALRATLEDT